MLSFLFSSLPLFFTKAAFIIIPFLLVTPTAKIHWYIPQATQQMKEAQKKLLIDPDSAYLMTTKAEHFMTLTVSQLRTIHDTSAISYDLLFGAFQDQEKFLTSLKNTAPKAYTKKFEEIEGFHKRNWYTAKLIYYNGVPPETPVIQSKLYTE